MKTVRAKFQCNSVEEQVSTKTAKLSAVYSDKGENKDFCDASPSGNFEIMINKDFPASEFFTPGEEYYLDFRKATPTEE